MPFFTYILVCWTSKSALEKRRPLYGHSTYTGHTNNIFRRLKEHIKGESFYTKQFYGNIRLGYLEVYQTRPEAYNREKKIKTFSRDKKVALIQLFEEEKPKELEFITSKIQELLIDLDKKFVWLI